LLCIAALGVLLTQVEAQGDSSYDYDYGYDSYGGYDEDEYDELDEYGYYGDTDEEYYEYYGYYADDFEGAYDDDSYDDYYDYYDEYEDYASALAECTFDAATKKVKLENGTASCDLKLEGLNSQADLLAGGIDGVYKLTNCHNGKPLYTREKSPAGEERLLWYSNTYGDWDISKGATPNEDEILMYGGEADHEPTPLFIKSWFLGADLMTKKDVNLGEDDYAPVKLTLKCADGKVFKEPQKDSKAQALLKASGPVLTDEEIEDKYRYIYEKYGRRPEPSPTVNFSFVVMLVMIGLSIVLAIPYVMLRKKGSSSKGPQQPIAASFAQIIQQSKKKQSGHAA
jgi:iron-regulated transporter 1